MPEQQGGWMRAGLLLLGLGMGGTASAQTFVPDFCQLSVGAAMGRAVPEPGFELITPGPVAYTYSPVLGQSCHWQPGFRRRTSISVDLMPLYRHSYSRLRVRAPLLLTATAGMSLRVRNAYIGGHVVTNGVALGAGGRLEWLYLYRAKTDMEFGFDLRVNVLDGVEPDLQVVLLHTIAGRRTRW